MFIKTREESKELKILKNLNVRMDLSPKEKLYYANLEKGYEGEKQFDELLVQLPNTCLIMNDLLFEKNNSEFQIDSLLFSQNKFHLFEVKNFFGDFYMDGDKWFSSSGTEINNPLFQLKRCETLFRHLLKDFGLHYPIEPYLVFINPEFTLYKAPLNQSIIFPTQLKRLMTDLNASSSHITEKQLKVAESLTPKHLSESAHSRIPHYDYHHLKKGITCAQCNSFMTNFSNERTLGCMKCGWMESVDSAVLRSIEQFILLFPERHITTNSIHNWCKVIESKKTIRRILKANFKLVGSSHRSSYIKSE